MQKQSSNPPQAEKIYKELTHHGDTRIDPFYWLRDRESPQTLSYLKAENAYREEQMRSTEPLQQKLFEEIKSRIKQDDQSVPYKKNGYWYYTRFVEGGEHPIYCRKKGSLEAEEEILIDANEEAKNHSYFKIGGLSISPDNEWLAYGVDTLGRRIYTLQFKHLPTGKIAEDRLENTTGSCAWCNDTRHVFYTLQDPDTLRPCRIYRHALGEDAQKDLEVYYEDDPTFVCVAYKSKSQQFIMIASHSTVSNEFRFLPADEPMGEFTAVQPRERHLEYAVVHYADHWYIRTNKDGAENFKLMKAPLQNPGKENWEDMIPHRKEVYLEDLEIFKEYLVLEERENGLTRLRVKRWDGSDDHYIQFESETYTASLGNNPDFESTALRYAYSALTTPPSVVDYDMEQRTKTLKKQLEVVGGYNEEEYASERIWATADDGTEVPISLVYKKSLRQKAGNPLLLYGYGSYGITMDPTFSPVRLSLLERGFICAIAHVRGGQYLGRQWYEQGKLLHKKNTFTDFIACGEKLISESFTSKQKLFALGGSAGGMLMGAVVNMRPDLFKGVIAAVPFVDVLTTMLDESIPLTTGEYDEWGNPNQKEFYDYMRSYSPYDNVKAQNYPAMLITTGLHDSQVQYWEPAKWTARLREMKTDDNPLYLYVNMDTGHGGASGRFEIFKETAMEYAFLLQQAGVKD